MKVMDYKAYKKAYTVDQVMASHGVHIDLEDYKAIVRYFDQRPYVSPWKVIHKLIENFEETLTTIKKATSE